MRLDRTTITAIAKLAGAHSTLSMMITTEGPAAYGLFKQNRDEVKVTLDAVQTCLGIETAPEIPTSKQDWIAAKESLARTATALRNDVRRELAQNHGEDAAKLYDFSLLASDYMWSSGMGFRTPAEVPREIAQLSKGYGASQRSINDFLSHPNPATSKVILEAVVRYFDCVTFFISYSHRDSDFVDALAECIEGPSVRVWRDAQHIHVSESISQKLEQAIPASDFFCLILSRNSIVSRWVQLEYRAALHSQTSTGRPHILPILIGKIELPLFLRDTKYADFSRDFNQGMEGILRLIKAVREVS